MNNPSDQLRVRAAQLRLDSWTGQISAELSRNAIPHVLLKGPSTAQWLYAPPRLYRDIDLLVPASALTRTVVVLERSGLAARAGGRLGEDCEHSLFMRTPNGIDVDLHVTLPTMRRPRGHQRDRTWRLLAPHLTALELDGTPVPALDEPARCVVLSLHALANAHDGSWAVQDLRLARSRASVRVWQQAEALAELLGVLPAFRAGIWLVEPGSTDLSSLPADVRLVLVGASASARTLRRIRDLPRRLRPGALLIEIFPSPRFIRRAVPGLPDTALGLARGYLTRWVLITRELGGRLR